MIAKPVVENKYWIIKDGDLKVGQIAKIKKGFKVTLGGTTTEARSLEVIREQHDLEFEVRVGSPKKNSFSVSGYPTNAEPFNPVYDLQKKLPLFVKEEKSKCWYAAGWFKVYQNNRVEWVLCPKLIVLQRYSHEGPFVEMSQ